MLSNIIITLILVIIIAGAAAYIYTAKKSGQTCIGCPHSKDCASNKCSCGCADEKLDS